MLNQVSYRIGGHYPAGLIDVWHCDQGGRYLLRPVLPQDQSPLGDMVRGLSAQSRRRRFHGAVRELSNEMLQYLTQVDYRQHMALVVTTFEPNGEALCEVIVAEARYIVDSQGDAAEFAIVVDDRRQRRGVGGRVLRALGRAAAQEGVRWLHGSVLGSNQPMLSLLDRFGFARTPDRDDDSLVRVERQLGVDAFERIESVGRSFWSRVSRRALQSTMGKRL